MESSHLHPDDSNRSSYTTGLDRCPSPILPASSDPESFMSLMTPRKVSDEDMLVNHESNNSPLLRSVPNCATRTRDSQGLVNHDTSACLTFDERAGDSHHQPEQEMPITTRPRSGSLKRPSPSICLVDLVGDDENPTTARTDQSRRPILRKTQSLSSAVVTTPLSCAGSNHLDDGRSHHHSPLLASPVSPWGQFVDVLVPPEDDHSLLTTTTLPEPESSTTMMRHSQWPCFIEEDREEETPTRQPLYKRARHHAMPSLFGSRHATATSKPWELVVNAHPDRVEDHVALKGFILCPPRTFSSHLLDTTREALNQLHV